MSKFISWVERRGKVRFLTGKQLFSEKGQKFIKKNGISTDDLCRHGTIRKWYGIGSGDGIDKECTDFSTPDNFPRKIVEAIKQGNMKGLSDIFPKGLLRKSLYDDYRAKRKLINADYEAKRKPLDDDYRAKRKSLDDDYEAKHKPLYADYEAKRKPLDDDYRAKRKSLNADYEAKLKPIDADYEAKLKPIDADYEAKLKPIDDDYWDLFAITKNRNLRWR